MLGIFFLLFGAIFTVMSPSYMVITSFIKMKNGVILFILILMGLMQMLISIFGKKLIIIGVVGVKQRNLEYMKIVILY